MQDEPVRYHSPYGMHEHDFNSPRKPDDDFYQARTGPAVPTFDPLNPPTGLIVHVGYLPHVTNADDLPCRAAIVTAPVRDGILSVTVFPAFSTSYNAKVESWHMIETCQRHVS